MGPDPENRMRDQDTGSPGMPVSSGCKCPVSRGIVVQEQDHLGELPAVFFLPNVLQLHQQRWVTLHVDSLALWKIINEEDAVFILKNRGENFSSGFFTRNFLEWGGVKRYASTPMIVALSPGYSDITRFRTKSAIAPGRKSIGSDQNKLHNLLRRLAPLTFLIRFQAFRDPLRGELPPVKIFMDDGPNPLMWDAQLFSYWFSRNPAVFQD